MRAEPMPLTFAPSAGRPDEMPDPRMTAPPMANPPAAARGSRTGQAVAAAAGAAELAHCRELMRGGSKSFFAASLVLPQRVRAPATALYAFCRLADDLIDGQGDPCTDTADPLACLQERLQRIYDGDPLAIDADRALTGVVARHGIPRELLNALLDGFHWDAQGRRYEHIEDLHDYAARVAGTVGAMMSLIMGGRDAGTLARACELGVAMQLTNIARDVGEDARNGRIYLPLQWLREVGIDPDAWLAAPRFDAAVAAVVKRLLVEADRLYQRAEAGIAALPRECRPAIRAARLVYAEIGREVERHGLDSISRRAVVSSQRKLALMARSLSAAVHVSAPRGAAPPPLEAIRFLVDAGTRGAPATGAALRPFRRPVGQRIEWMAMLFEDLVERQRLAPTVNSRGGAGPR